ncbi:hypothetical protein [Snodgrassella sp.]|nr:hypothetical protein [Snodgrassella sp.]MCO6525386.1 hypothetical protein [Snodgrassella sp.]
MMIPSAANKKITTLQSLSLIGIGSLQSRDVKALSLAKTDNFLHML